MNAQPSTKASVLCAVLACCAGAASAQQFSDNFDSGSLAAWGDPIVPGGPITNQVVSAATGSLRMSAVGSSTISPEGLALPLAASTANPNLYQNGSASVDIDLDSSSLAGMGARGDLASRSNLAFFVATRTDGTRRLGISVIVNGALAAQRLVDLNFDPSAVRLDATWNGSDLSVTATDRLTLESMSTSLTDSSLTGGGLFLLGIERTQQNVFPFGATFDNFTIVPAPGALALFGVAGLGAIRRRR